jgi:HEAT repeat protein
VRKILDFGFWILDFGTVFRSFLILCFLCACTENSFSQTIEDLSNQIRFGITEVKRNALFEIRNRKSEETSRIAVSALSDSDEIVRATAAFAVIYLNRTEAFNALAPNLKDKSEIVRRETAYALGKVQNPNAVNPLIQTFQNKKEKSIEVKNACIVALGEIGDISAGDFLLQILKQKPSHKNEFLRRSAARSIGQIAQIIQIKESYAVTPESFLPEKYKLFALEKYQNLSEKIPQFRAAVPILIKILQTEKESDDTKRETAFALGAIGDSSANSILQANLNSKDYYLAEICQESLKKISSVKLSE